MIKKQKGGTSPRCAPPPPPPPPRSATAHPIVVFDADFSSDIKKASHDIMRALLNRQVQGSVLLERGKSEEE